jgi:Xaa-Pro aminopeptidase
MIPLEMTGAERAAHVLSRVEQLRALLHARGAGGVLLRARHNVAWLTLGAQAHIVLSSESTVAGVLVTSTEVVVLAPVNEAARLTDEEFGTLPVEIAQIPWEDAAAMGREAQRRTTGTLLADQDLEADLLPLRSTLGAIEHARLAWLGERAQAAMDVALEHVRVGSTEFEIGGLMEAELGRDAIRAPVVLAAADERIATYRHPLPTLHPVRERLMLIVCAERWGLVVAGTTLRDLVPPSAVVALRMEQSIAALRAMENASRPGVTLGDVIAVAQREYADFGYPGEWRLHHQGGSIGYRTREVVAVPGDRTPIVAGMALAWNPSITGAKAESTILLAPADGAMTRVLG